MTSHYIVEPEVAGGLGEHTVLDGSRHPPLVSHLHYEFEDWHGDAIVTSFPCFLVTGALRAALEAMGASGFWFDEVEVTRSEQFDRFFPQVAHCLPRFWWLRIVGVAGQGDIGATDDARLVVSERVLALLKSHGLSWAKVGPYT
jgi:hypothetical protein